MGAAGCDQAAACSEGARWMGGRLFGRSAGQRFARLVVKEPSVTRCMDSVSLGPLCLAPRGL